MANAANNLKEIKKLKLAGLKAEAKNLKKAGLIKAVKVEEGNYEAFSAFLANVLSDKKSEQKEAIAMAKSGDFVTGTLDPDEFIETAETASGLSSTISEMAKAASNKRGKELWKKVADMLKEVSEARRGKDVGKKTTTKAGATFARKMFSVGEARLWKKLEKFLKKNGIKTPAGELLKMNQAKLMIALADQGKLDLGAFLKKLIDDYNEAAEIANTKGKEYDAISSGTAFLTEEQIKSHLNKFANGLGAFISEDADFKINKFNSWGRNNNFVTTIDRIEGVLRKANSESNTFGVIEKELGFDVDQFKNQCPNKSFKTYTISKEQLEGKLQEILRLPEATDDSAFAEEWVAGGLTAGGNPEGVIAAISRVKGVSGVSPFEEMVTVTTYEVQEDGTWKKS